MKFYGNTDNGQLNIFNWEQAQSWAQSHPNRKIEIDVNLYSEKRSIEQNKLYQAYAKILSAELGIEFEEMKELIRYKFLKREKVVEGTGEVMEYLEHTSKLSKPEFVEFCEQIQRWSAMTFGITLESPNEQTKAKF